MVQRWAVIVLPGTGVSGGGAETLILPGKRIDCPNGKLLRILQFVKARQQIKLAGIAQKTLRNATQRFARTHRIGRRVASLCRR